MRPVAPVGLRKPFLGESIPLRPLISSLVPTLIQGVVFELTGEPDPDNALVVDL